MAINSLGASAWRIEHFPNQGDYVVTNDGCKLFRVEAGVIVLYNKNLKTQVRIDIDALRQLVNLS